MWKSHSVRRKSTHKILETHVNPVYTDKQTHTRHATKPPVLLGPAVSAVISKAACGARLQCCGADQVQMCVGPSDGPAHLCAAAACFVTLRTAPASKLITTGWSLLCFSRLSCLARWQKQRNWARFEAATSVWLLARVHRTRVCLQIRPANAAAVSWDDGGTLLMFSFK